MGQFHEVTPALDGGPMEGKRVRAVIVVTFFHQKARFDGPAMAPCAVAPSHDVFRRQRPPRHPDPVRVMRLSVRIHPRFVAQGRVDRPGFRVAILNPVTEDIVDPGKDLGAIPPAMHATLLARGIQMAQALDLFPHPG